MKRFRNIQWLLLSAFSLILLAGIQACDDSTTGYIQPDFSTVPDAWDIAEADTSFTTEDGLTIYVYEKGNEEIPPVTQRDQVSIRYTGRTHDGTVFTSSYSNGRTSPNTFSNLTPTTVGNSPSLIEGFRKGVAGDGIDGALEGMHEGEERTLIIPPSMGYGGSRQGTNGFDLRNDTLVYDIELVEILS